MQYNVIEKWMHIGSRFRCILYTTKLPANAIDIMVILTFAAYSYKITRKDKGNHLIDIIIMMNISYGAHSWFQSVLIPAGMCRIEI